MIKLPTICSPVIRSALLIFAAVALVCFVADPGRAQTVAKAPSPKAQRIKIYFYHEPGEYIDLSPVTRTIRSSAPARTAMLALLAGPTRGEMDRGFDGLLGANDFKLGKLNIKDGTARVNFTSTPGWAGFPGDIAPIRFKKAVEMTLKQFRSVKRVIVTLDGDVDFASDD